MLSKFISLYRRRKQNAHLRSISKYLQLKDSLIYGESFNVELRDPKPGHIYLEAGEEDILNGDYIFETSEGHIRIGDRVYIGGGQIISRNEILIGDDVVIAWGCLIYDHNSHSIYWDERKDDIPVTYTNMKNGLPAILNKNWSVVRSAPIHIKNKAWIGANVTILKGVTIGEGAVVGAGSVVVDDVEPWTIVRGNPARAIKKITVADGKGCNR